MKRFPVLRTFFLVIMACVLSAGVYIYINFGSEAQRTAYAVAALEKAFERPISMGSVSVGLWPRPYAQAHHILMQAPWGSFYADSLWVGMGWSSLFKLHFLPGHIILENPAVRLDLNALEGQTTLQSLAQDLHAVKNKPEKLQDIFSLLRMSPVHLPEELTDLDIDIHNGFIDISHTDTTYSLSGLNGWLNIPGFFPGRANFDIHEMLHRKAEKTLYSAEKTHIAIDQLSLPSDNYPFIKANTNVTSQFTVPGYFKNLGMSLQAKSGTWKGGNKIKGDLHLDGIVIEKEELSDLQAEIPFSLNSPKTGQPELLFTKASVHFENDSVEWNGRFATDTASQEPVLSAHATVNRFSLTRWFGFARDLVPGLQIALNDLQGSLDLEIRNDQLHVSKLEVLLSGMPFYGSASIDTFTKPVLRITGETEHADLNKVFPELQGEMVAPPELPQPFITGEGEGEGLDYDIRLSSKTSNFARFDCNGLNFQAASEGAGRFVAVQVAGLYGGRFSTRLDIFSEDLRMQAQVERMDIDPPAQLLAGRSVAGGRLRGTVDVKGRTDSFDSFLSSLEGTINFTVENGFILAHGGRRQNFSLLNIGLQGRGPGPLQEGQTLPESLAFQGNWTFALNTPDWQGSLNAQGSVLFASDTFAPLSAQNLNGRLRGSHMGIDVDLNTQLSLDLVRDRLEMRRFNGTIAGGRASGSLNVTSLSGNASARGQIDIENRGLRPILQRLDILPKNLPANAFESLQLSTRYDLTPEQWRLDEVSGTLDDSRFTGSLNYTPGTTPMWRFSLNLTRLDTARYMPPSAQTAQRQVNTAKPWDIAALRRQNCVGQLNITQLVTTRGLTLERVRIPITLRGGVLQSDAITAAMYGGNIDGSFRFEARNDGLLSQMRFNSRTVDMAAMTQALQFPTILGGRATSSLNLHGLLRSNDDIPRELSGNWNFAVRQGFFRPADGNPTTFQTFSVSGTLERGVIISDDLQLRGDRLNVSGRGEINLVDWTLDYRLNVSSPGLRNIPVNFSGRLDDPERSISAMHVVLGAVGGLGAGVVNMVQGIIFSPFRLLTPKNAPAQNR